MRNVICEINRLDEINWTNLILLLLLIGGIITALIKWIGGYKK